MFRRIFKANNIKENNRRHFKTMGGICFLALVTSDPTGNLSGRAGLVSGCLGSQALHTNIKAP